MPLTAKGRTLKRALTKEYGEKKGTSVLYAGKNSGRFTGIDRASAMLDALRNGSSVRDAVARTADVSLGTHPWAGSAGAVQYHTSKAATHTQRAAIGGPHAAAHTTAAGAHQSAVVAHNNVARNPVPATRVTAMKATKKADTASLATPVHDAIVTPGVRAVATPRVRVGLPHTAPRAHGVSHRWTRPGVHDGPVSELVMSHLSRERAFDAGGGYGDKNYTGHAMGKGAKVLHTTSGHPSHEHAAKAALAGAPKPHLVKSVQTGYGYGGGFDMRYHSPSKIATYSKDAATTRKPFDPLIAAYQDGTPQLLIGMGGKKYDNWRDAWRDYVAGEHPCLPAPMNLTRQVEDAAGTSSMHVKHDQYHTAQVGEWRPHAKTMPQAHEYMVAHGMAAQAHRTAIQAAGTPQYREAARKAGAASRHVYSHVPRPPVGTGDAGMPHGHVGYAHNKAGEVIHTTPPIHPTAEHAAYAAQRAKPRADHFSGGRAGEEPTFHHNPRAGFKNTGKPAFGPGSDAAVAEPGAKVANRYGWKKSAVTSTTANYSHPSHPGHVLQVHTGSGWSHFGPSGRMAAAGHNAEALNQHLVQHHSRDSGVTILDVPHEAHAGLLARGYKHKGPSIGRSGEVHHLYEHAKTGHRIWVGNPSPKSGAGKSHDSVDSQNSAVRQSSVSQREYRQPHAAADEGNEMACDCAKMMRDGMREARARGMSAADAVRHTVLRHRAFHDRAVRDARRRWRDDEVGGSGEQTVAEHPAYYCMSKPPEASSGTVVGPSGGAQTVWGAPATDADRDRRMMFLGAMRRGKSVRDALDMCRDEHLGFAKLKSKLAHRKGVSNPGALAAYIGRRKFGAAGMARKAAAGR